MTEDEAKALSEVIETTMQVIVALRWAAHQGAMLPEPLDAASQEVLDVLYEWQRHRNESAPPPADVVAAKSVPDDTPPPASASHRFSTFDNGLYL